MNTLPVGLCGEFTTMPARPRPEGRAQLVGVDRPVRLVEGHVAGDGAGQDRVGAVVLVVGLEDDDLVARDRAAPSIAATIASVAPQVTVTIVSGSIGDQPGKCSTVEVAIASRSGFAPQVIAYWLMSSWRARAAASFSSGGQAKSGKPCARLTAPCDHGQPVHLADDRLGEAGGLGRDARVRHAAQSTGRRRRVASTGARSRPRWRRQRQARAASRARRTVTATTPAPALPRRSRAR